MSNHTPGPWRYFENCAGEYSIFPTSCGHFNSEGKGYAANILATAESEGDANIIAAAPELLDALETIFEYMAYVPAYQIYSGAEETYDAAIRAHEDVERVKALLKRIYEGEDTE